MIPSYAVMEQYINQWLHTATLGKVVSHFAWGTNRMQLKCNVCEQQLTAKVPESSDQIDYGVQQFVKTHAHKGDCNHMHSNGLSAWMEIPKTGSWQCQKCMMWMHGDALPPTAVTLDFKKVNSNASNNSDVTFKTYSTGNTNNAPAPIGKIDENYQNQLAIQKQMKEYEASMEVNSLELELKVKKIQLEAAKQAASHLKSGATDFVDKGFISAGELKALMDKQEELQAEILEQEKAKEQALENILKIKILQEKLGKTKMEFHDTGHKPNVVVPTGPKPKPLKIATGRKFR